MDKRFRTVLSVLLLPIAFVQAWVYELVGKPYLPIVGKDPGPERQRLLATGADDADETDQADQAD